MPEPTLPARETEAPATRSAFVALALALVGLLAGCASVALRDEIEQGREMAAQLRLEHEFVRSRVVHEYVVGVGRSLLAAAGPQPYRYRFNVIIDDAPNAFAVSGGHVYITSGALVFLKSTQQVAALFAHEIGHVVLRHGIKTDDKWIQEGYKTSRGPLGSIGLTLVSQNVMNHFRQAAEMEADAFSVQLLGKAGYCAAAQAEALALLASVPALGPPGTHPSIYLRINTIHEQLGSSDPCPAADAPDPLAEVQEILAKLASEPPSAVALPGEEHEP